MCIMKKLERRLTETMNLVKVLSVMVPVLNIVSSLVSGYVSKQNMMHMIKEEVARVVKES